MLNRGTLSNQNLKKLSSGVLTAKESHLSNMGTGFRMSGLKNMVFIAHLHQSPSLTHALDPPNLLQWDIKQF